MARGRGRKRWGVFVSHSGVDSWVATQIAKAIEGCGAEPFLSEQLVGGANIAQAIVDALRRSREWVGYLTPWALERPWVWLEMGAAWGLRLRHVCLLHGVTPEQLRSDDRIPNYLTSLVLVDINDIQRGYLRPLKRRIREEMQQRG